MPRPSSSGRCTSRRRALRMSPSRSGSRSRATPRVSAVASAYSVSTPRSRCVVILLAAGLTERGEEGGAVLGERALDGALGGREQTVGGSAGRGVGGRRRGGGSGLAVAGMALIRVHGRI